MNKFALRLRDLRREVDITADELSKILGCSYANISQWENGRNYPKQEMAEKLCDYFNISLDYLMGRSDIKNPNHNINITKDDFTVAFSNLQGNLTEEDKRQILKMAQFLAEENKNNK